MPKNKIISADKFYDSISDIYDKMIDFEKNLELRFNAYKEIFPSASTVADIGCGIGLDSIALAKNKHNVTAFDISPNMIAELKRNAEKFNLTIDAYEGSFSSIPNKFYSKFDYVISVGNTIAHLTSEQLRSAIKKIHTLLKPKGKIFLHVLNYDLIKKNNKRINNIANRQGKIIIRFYDFLNDHLNFNIITFPEESPKEFKLVTTIHYPHNKNEITAYLKASGFGKVIYFGNFYQEKFIATESKDLFVSAEKL